MSRENFMRRALACAEKAKALGEIPVGAVIVRDGKVIASGYNRRERGKSALLHAEMIALHRACKRVGSWRLSDCDLYVTLEPCPMCTGAIINARIAHVYIGAMDPKAGCMGSVCDLTKQPFNHQPVVDCGILEQECSGILSDFFRDLRNEKKPEIKAISLRPFTQDDVPALKQYLYAKRSEKSIRAIVDQWNTRLLEGRYSETFAVVAEDTLAGYARLTETSRDSVQGEVLIFSHLRGRTYGGQAVRRILALAKERGYSSVTACVRTSGVAARRLCDSVGFVLCGERLSEKGTPRFDFKYSFKE
ncbi:MAG: tRNA adenosine(34) deaminase TadA [Clostridia bacterium]|nr:tRNA adenosine(34) deaminase TadA [Clostridia bacterium]